MKRRIQHIAAAMLLSAIVVTGCGQKPTPTTKASEPGTTTSNGTLPKETGSGLAYTVPGATQPGKPKATAVLTKPSGKTSDGSAASKPGEKEPDLSEIKTGDAYDTATVRRWMWDTTAKNYPKQKLVFLTFDDGPSWNNTPKVLDVLKANNIHGTFFYLTSGGFEDNADIVRRTAAEGHRIAIHSNSHEYDYLYPHGIADPEIVVDDAMKTVAKIKKILGNDWTTSAYRFPGGSMSWVDNAEAKAAMKKTIQGLADHGLQYMDWNTMTGDADLNNKDKSPEGLVSFLKKQTESAEGHVMVVLMHDAAHVNNTPKALQGVIDYFKGMGYEFATLK
ncbi:Peptidoglycan N-acetylglucosamine deacetylase [Clostridiaceae bacterium JG1575]|nr:Peptidoglycan N-acetylglucosamine deacetylase [Clostridiaceae bacterium JG1575]